MCHICLLSIQRQYFVPPGQISQLPFPGSLPLFLCFLSLSLIPTLCPSRANKPLSWELGLRTWTWGSWVNTFPFTQEILLYSWACSPESPSSRASSRILWGVWGQESRSSMLRAKELAQCSVCAGEIPGANLQILGSNLVYLILHKGCDCIVLKQEPYWLFWNRHTVLQTNGIEELFIMHCRGTEICLGKVIFSPSIEIIE